MRKHAEQPRAEPTGNAPILVPLVPARGLIPPNVDCYLSNLARSSDRSDPRLRNALYAAFEPRLIRMTDRLWYRSVRFTWCERDDLDQEMFVCFADLLDQWHGRGSFPAYLLGSFPWRLRDAAARIAPPRTSLFDSDSTIALAADDSYAAAGAIELLERIVARMNPFNRRLLLLRVRDGRSFRYMAQDLGVSHRTVRRAWNQLLISLHKELTS